MARRAHRCWLGGRSFHFDAASRQHIGGFVKKLSGGTISIVIARIICFVWGTRAIRAGRQTGTGRKISPLVGFDAGGKVKSTI
jgi:hypothetical protein